MPPGACARRHDRRQRGSGGTAWSSRTESPRRISSRTLQLPSPLGGSTWRGLRRTRFETGGGPARRPMPACGIRTPTWPRGARPGSTGCWQGRRSRRASSTPSVRLAAEALAALAVDQALPEANRRAAWSASRRPDLPPPLAAFGAAYLAQMHTPLLELRMGLVEARDGKCVILGRHTRTERADRPGVPTRSGRVGARRERSSSVACRLRCVADRGDVELPGGAYRPPESVRILQGGPRRCPIG